jgi:hypothetical protein
LMDCASRFAPSDFVGSVVQFLVEQ